MFILPTMLLALIVAAALATVIWAIINYEKIINWFRSIRKIKNHDEIAFTLKTKIAAGDYELVQGIFNSTKQEIVEGQVIKSTEMDSVMLKQKELAIYE